MLRSIGQNPTEDEILSLVIEYDVNGDGTIDFDEFLEMMSKHTRETVDQTAEMREAFKIFDRDGNGYIDFKELKQVLLPIFPTYYFDSTIRKKKSYFAISTTT